MLKLMRELRWKLKRREALLENIITKSSPQNFGKNLVFIFLVFAPRLNGYFCDILGLINTKDITPNVYCF